MVELVELIAAVINDKINVLSVPRNNNDEHL